MFLYRGISIVANRALIDGFIKSSIKDMLTTRGRPLDPSKQISLMILEPLWVCAAIGNTLSSIVSNFPLGNGLGFEI